MRGRKPQTRPPFWFRTCTYFLKICTILSGSNFLYMYNFCTKQLYMYKKCTRCEVLSLIFLYMYNFCDTRTVHVQFFSVHFLNIMYNPMYTFRNQKMGRDQGFRCSYKGGAPQNSTLRVDFWGCGLALVKLIIFSIYF